MKMGKMKGMNRVTLVGNTGGDPVVKLLSDGVALAKFAMATTDYYRTKDGRLQSDTQWHNVVLWRGLAELARKYLRKGSLLLLEGKLRYRKYKDKEGDMRYLTEIVGDNLILLNPKPIPVDHLEEDEEAADLDF